MYLHLHLYLHWQMSSVKPIMGFVPQEDTMHRNLSVKENLQFYAWLKLDARSNLRKAKLLVNSVLVIRAPTLAVSMIWY